MKKIYAEIKKKYELPEFENINKDFQISSIEEKDFLLKEISKKMTEKIELFSNILEEILNPERISSSHESSMFTDLEKKEILRVYRKLHLFQRENSCLEITYEEEENAKFIEKIFNEWQEIKPMLKKTLTKLKESWNHDKKSKLELSYFG